MKKLFYFFAIIAIFVSCNEKQEFDSSDNSLKPNPQKKEIAADVLTPEQIGEYHNLILEYMEKQLDEKFSEYNYEDVMLSEIDAVAIRAFQEYNEINNLGIQNDKITEIYYSSQNMILETEDIFSLASETIHRLSEYPEVLSQEETVILSEMFDAIDSAKDFDKHEAYDIIRQAISQAYEKLEGIEYSFRTGAPSNDDYTTAHYVSKVTIAVASNSLEYWNAYPENPFDPTPIEPYRVVVCDALGALAMGGIGIIKEGRKEGDIDWVNVGLDALGGAVCGSFPGSKWISRIKW